MQLNAPVLSNSDLLCDMTRKAGTVQVPIHGYLRQECQWEWTPWCLSPVTYTLQYSHVYEVPKEENHTYVKDFTRLDD